MIEMTKLTYKHQWDERRHHVETVTDNESVPVRIPADNIDVLVTVHPTDSVDVYFTNDDYETVDAGNANWIEWENGNINAPAYALIPKGATAVKCNSVGSTKFVVTA